MGPLFIDIAGYELSQEDREILQHPLVGGVIFFSRNYADPAQLNALVQQIRMASKQRLLLAVDQEGGRVQRFRTGFTLLPAPAAFLGLHSMDEACELAQLSGWMMAAELVSLDIDLSFAPCLDIGNTCPAIGDRAFSDTLAATQSVAEAYIRGMHTAGMKVTAKHFPGHGHVLVDSHLETPIDARLPDVIKHNDLSIFANLIQKNMIDAVMPAHVIYTHFDRRPASMSPYWLHEVLRHQLHFKGIVFSDDLSMEGAAYAGSYVDRGMAALEAGCDMLLLCNKRSATIELLDHLPISHVKQAATLCHQSVNDFHALRRTKQWKSAHERLQSVHDEWLAHCAC